MFSESHDFPSHELLGFGGSLVPAVYRCLKLEGQGCLPLLLLLDGWLDRLPDDALGGWLDI